MKKPDFVSPSFFSAILNYKKKTKVFSRDATLVPKTLYQNYIVYNGLRFLSVLVSEEILGYKLGEFSQSRRRYYFKKKKNKTRK